MPSSASAGPAASSVASELTVYADADALPPDAAYDIGALVQHASPYERAPTLVADDASPYERAPTIATDDASPYERAPTLVVLKLFLY